jgi:D-proline reductase (dithiol) PrdB
MVETERFPKLNPEDYAGKFEAWREVVDRMHSGSVFTSNPKPAWSPLRVPLSEARVALVTTAGAHLKTQEPFDLRDERGDWTWRRIPGGTQTQGIAVSHEHYDTGPANEDPNVVLPLDALRALVGAGMVGSESPLHAGMMGWIPNGKPLVEETAPEVAAELVRAGVDAAVLTPG